MGNKHKKTRKKKIPQKSCALLFPSRSSSVQTKKKILSCNFHFPNFPTDSFSITCFAALTDLPQVPKDSQSRTQKWNFRLWPVEWGLEVRFNGGMVEGQIPHDVHHTLILSGQE